MLTGGLEFHGSVDRDRQRLRACLDLGCGEGRLDVCAAERCQLLPPWEETTRCADTEPDDPESVPTEFTRHEFSTLVELCERLGDQRLLGRIACSSRETIIDRLNRYTFLQVAE